MAKEGTWPVKAADVLMKVLDERGLRAHGTLADIARKWESSVGDSIAKHAVPDTIKGGRLTLMVDGPVWMNQLSMMAPDIIAKVNAALGKEEVTELRFRAGKAERPETKKKAAAFVPKKRKPLPEENAAAEEAAGRIKDPDIKRSAKKLFLASCSREK